MTDKTPITMEDRHAHRRAIADYVRADHSAAQASRHFGASLSCVYAACAEFNVQLGNRASTALTCRLLYDLMYTTTTLARLGETHDVGSTRVHKILTHAREAGFRFHHRQDRQGRETDEAPRAQEGSDHE